MRRTAFVAAALAASLLPVGAAGAQTPKPGPTRKPTISITEVKFDAGKFVVSGKYMCPKEDEAVDGIIIRVEQWNTETDAWHDSYVNIEADKPCTTRSRGYSATLTDMRLDGFEENVEAEIHAQIDTVTGRYADSQDAYVPDS